MEYRIKNCLGNMSVEVSAPTQEGALRLWAALNEKREPEVESAHFLQILRALEQIREGIAEVR